MLCSGQFGTIYQISNGRLDLELGFLIRLDFIVNNLHDLKRFEENNSRDNFFMCTNLLFLLTKPTSLWPVFPQT